LFTNRVVTFHQTRTPDIAQIIETRKAGSEAEFISVQSFPIYSILLALNRTTVDFFSLDVEGFELAVLKTIPWDKVDIKVYDLQLYYKGEFSKL
jgi:Methyltransferase FkbM domain